MNLRPAENKDQVFPSEVLRLSELLSVEPDKIIAYQEAIKKHGQIIHFLIEVYDKTMLSSMDERTIDQQAVDKKNKWFKENFGQLIEEMGIDKKALDSLSIVEGQRQALLKALSDYCFGSALENEKDLSPDDFRREKIRREDLEQKEFPAEKREIEQDIVLDKFTHFYQKDPEKRKLILEEMNSLTLLAFRESVLNQPQSELSPKTMALLNFQGEEFNNYLLFLRKHNQVLRELLNLYEKEPNFALEILRNLRKGRENDMVTETELVNCARTREKIRQALSFLKEEIWGEGNEAEKMRDKINVFLKRPETEKSQILKEIDILDSLT